jgi:signal transduction histidine kinase
VKYGPAGGTVRVDAERADGMVRLRVRDEGPGIPEAERTRVFRPFYRIRRDEDGAEGGSGIGLAVVRELVEAHGGRARVGAAPAGGAEVVVELPAAEGA